MAELDGSDGAVHNLNNWYDQERAAQKAAADKYDQAIEEQAAKAREQAAKAQAEQEKQHGAGHGDDGRNPQGQFGEDRSTGFS